MILPSICSINSPVSNNKSYSFKYSITFSFDYWQLGAEPIINTNAAIGTGALAIADKLKIPSRIF